MVNHVVLFTMGVGFTTHLCDTWDNLQPNLPAHPVNVLLQAML